MTRTVEADIRKTITKNFVSLDTRGRFTVMDRESVKSKLLKKINSMPEVIKYSNFSGVQFVRLFKDTLRCSNVRIGLTMSEREKAEDYVKMTYTDLVKNLMSSVEEKSTHGESLTAVVLGAAKKEWVGQLLCSSFHRYDKKPWDMILFEIKDEMIRERLRNMGESAGRTELTRSGILPHRQLQAVFEKCKLSEVIEEIISLSESELERAMYNFCSNLVSETGPRPFNTAVTSLDIEGDVRNDENVEGRSAKGMVIVDNENSFSRIWIVLRAGRKKDLRVKLSISIAVETMLQQERAVKFLSLMAGHASRIDCDRLDITELSDEAWSRLFENEDLINYMTEKSNYLAANYSDALPLMITAGMKPHEANLLQVNSLWDILITAMLNKAGRGSDFIGVPELDRHLAAAFSLLIRFSTVMETLEEKVEFFLGSLLWVKLVLNETAYQEMTQDKMSGKKDVNVLRRWPDKLGYASQVIVCSIALLGENDCDRLGYGMLPIFVMINGLTTGMRGVKLMRLGVLVASMLTYASDRKAQDENVVAYGKKIGIKFSNQDVRELSSDAAIGWKIKKICQVMTAQMEFMRRERTNRRLGLIEAADAVATAIRLHNETEERCKEIGEESCDHVDEIRLAICNYLASRGSSDGDLLARQIATINAILMETQSGYDKGEEDYEPSEAAIDMALQIVQCRDKMHEKKVADGAARGNKEKTTELITRKAESIASTDTRTRAMIMAKDMVRVGDSEITERALTEAYQRSTTSSASLMRIKEMTLPDRVLRGATVSEFTVMDSNRLVKGISITMGDQNLASIIGSSKSDSAGPAHISESVGFTIKFFDGFEFSVGSRLKFNLHQMRRSMIEFVEKVDDKRKALTIEEIEEGKEEKEETRRAKENRDRIKELMVEAMPSTSRVDIEDVLEGGDDNLLKVVMASIELKMRKLRYSDEYKEIKFIIMSPVIALTVMNVGSMGVLRLLDDMWSLISDSTFSVMKLLDMPDDAEEVKNSLFKIGTSIVLTYATGTVYILALGMIGLKRGSLSLIKLIIKVGDLISNAVEIKLRKFTNVVQEVLHERLKAAIEGENGLLINWFRRTHKDEETKISMYKEDDEQKEQLKTDESRSALRKLISKTMKNVGNKSIMISQILARKAYNCIKLVAKFIIRIWKKGRATKDYLVNKIRKLLRLNDNGRLEIVNEGKDAETEEEAKPEDGKSSDIKISERDETETVDEAESVRRNTEGTEIRAEENNEQAVRDKGRTQSKDKTEDDETSGGGSKSENETLGPEEQAEECQGGETETSSDERENVDESARNEAENDKRAPGNPTELTGKENDSINKDEGILRATETGKQIQDEEFFDTMEEKSDNDGEPEKRQGNDKERKEELNESKLIREETRDGEADAEIEAERTRESEEIEEPTVETEADGGNSGTEKCSKRETSMMDRMIRKVKKSVVEVAFGLKMTDDDVSSSNDVNFKPIVEATAADMAARLNINLRCCEEAIRGCCCLTKSTTDEVRKIIEASREESSGHRGLLMSGSRRLKAHGPAGELGMIRKAKELAASVVESEGVSIVLINNGKTKLREKKQSEGPRSRIFAYKPTSNKQDWSVMRTQAVNNDGKKVQGWVTKGEDRENGATMIMTARHLVSYGETESNGLNDDGLVILGADYKRVVGMEPENAIELDDNNEDRDNDGDSDDEREPAEDARFNKMKEAVEMESGSDFVSMAHVEEDDYKGMSGGPMIIKKDGSLRILVLQLDKAVKLKRKGYRTVIMGMNPAEDPRTIIINEDAEVVVCEECNNVSKSDANEDEKQTRNEEGASGSDDLKVKQGEQISNGEDESSATSSVSSSSDEEFLDLSDNDDDERGADESDVKNGNKVEKTSSYADVLMGRNTRVTVRSGDRFSKTFEGSKRSSSDLFCRARTEQEAAIIAIDMLSNENEIGLTWLSKTICRLMRDSYSSNKTPVLVVGSSETRLACAVVFSTMEISYRWVKSTVGLLEALESNKRGTMKRVLMFDSMRLIGEEMMFDKSTILEISELAIVKAIGIRRSGETSEERSIILTASLLSNTSSISLVEGEDDEYKVEMGGESRVRKLSKKYGDYSFVMLVRSSVKVRPESFDESLEEIKKKSRILVISESFEREFIHAEVREVSLIFQVPVNRIEISHPGAFAGSTLVGKIKDSDVIVFKTGAEMYQSETRRVIKRCILQSSDAIRRACLEMIKMYLEKHDAAGDQDWKCCSDLEKLLKNERIVKTTDKDKLLMALMIRGNTSARWTDYAKSVGVLEKTKLNDREVFDYESIERIIKAMSEEKGSIEFDLNETQEKIINENVRVMKITVNKDESKLRQMVVNTMRKVSVAAYDVSSKLKKMILKVKERIVNFAKSVLNKLSGLIPRRARKVATWLRRKFRERENETKTESSEKTEERQRTEGKTEKERKRRKNGSSKTGFEGQMRREKPIRRNKIRCKKTSVVRETETETSESGSRKEEAEDQSESGIERHVDGVEKAEKGERQKWLMSRIWIKLKTEARRVISWLKRKIKRKNKERSVETETKQTEDESEKLSDRRSQEKTKESEEIEDARTVERDGQEEDETEDESDKKTMNVLKKIMLSMLNGPMRVTRFIIRKVRRLGRRLKRKARAVVKKMQILADFTTKETKRQSVSKLKGLALGDSDQNSIETAIASRAVSVGLIALAIRRPSSEGGKNIDSIGMRLMKAAVVVIASDVMKKAMGCISRRLEKMMGKAMKLIMLTGVTADLLLRLSNRELTIEAGAASITLGAIDDEMLNSMLEMLSGAVFAIKSKLNENGDFAIKVTRNGPDVSRGGKGTILRIRKTSAVITEINIGTSASNVKLISKYVKMGAAVYTTLKRALFWSKCKKMLKRLWEIISMKQEYKGPSGLLKVSKCHSKPERLGMIAAATAIVIGIGMLANETAETDAAIIGALAERKHTADNIGTFMREARTYSRVLRLTSVTVAISSIIAGTDNQKVGGALSLGILAWEWLTSKNSEVNIRHGLADAVTRTLAFGFSRTTIFDLIEAWWSDTSSKSLVVSSISITSGDDEGNGKGTVNRLKVKEKRSGELTLSKKEERVTKTAVKQAEIYKRKEAEVLQRIKTGKCNTLDEVEEIISIANGSATAKSDMSYIRRIIELGILDRNAGDEEVNWRQIAAKTADFSNTEGQDDQERREGREPTTLKIKDIFKNQIIYVGRLKLRKREDDELAEEEKESKQKKKLFWDDEIWEGVIEEKDMRGWQAAGDSRKDVLLAIAERNDKPAIADIADSSVNMFCACLAEWMMGRLGAKLSDVKVRLGTVDWKVLIKAVNQKATSGILTRNKTKMALTAAYLPKNTVRVEARRTELLTGKMTIEGKIVNVFAKRRIEKKKKGRVIPEEYVITRTIQAHESDLKLAVLDIFAVQDKAVKLTRADTGLMIGVNMFIEFAQDEWVNRKLSEKRAREEKKTLIRVAIDHSSYDANQRTWAIMAVKEIRKEIIAKACKMKAMRRQMCKIIDKIYDGLAIKWFMTASGDLMLLSGQQMTGHATTSSDNSIRALGYALACSEMMIRERKDMEIIKSSVRVQGDDTKFNVMIKDDVSDDAEEKVASMIERLMMNLGQEVRREKISFAKRDESSSFLSHSTIKRKFMMRKQGQDGPDDGERVMIELEVPSRPDTDIISMLASSLRTGVKRKTRKEISLMLAKAASFMMMYGSKGQIAILTALIIRIANKLLTMIERKKAVRVSISLEKLPWLIKDSAITGEFEIDPENVLKMHGLDCEEEGLKPSEWLIEMDTETEQTLDKTIRLIKNVRLSVPSLRVDEDFEIRDALEKLQKLRKGKENLIEVAMIKRLTSVSGRAVSLTIKEDISGYVPMLELKRRIIEDNSDGVSDIRNMQIAESIKITIGSDGSTDEKKQTIEDMLAIALKGEPDSYEAEKLTCMESKEGILICLNNTWKANTERGVVAITTEETELTALMDKAVYSYSLIAGIAEMNVIIEKLKLDQTSMIGESIAEKRSKRMRIELLGAVRTNLELMRDGDYVEDLKETVTRRSEEIKTALCEVISTKVRNFYLVK